MYIFGLKTIFRLDRGVLATRFSPEPISLQYYYNNLDEERGTNIESAENTKFDEISSVLADRNGSLNSQIERSRMKLNNLVRK